MESLVALGFFTVFLAGLAGYMHFHRADNEPKGRPTDRRGYLITAEGGVFVARALEVDVASDGRTAQEALANLEDALELYFEGNEGEGRNHRS